MRGITYGACTGRVNIPSPCSCNVAIMRLPFLELQHSDCDGGCCETLKPGFQEPGRSRTTIELALP